MIDFSAHQPLIKPEELPDDLQSDALAIAVVGDAIRTWCGWHIAPSVTETITVDHRGRQVVALPSMHVTDIAEIVDRDGAPVTGWDWSASGVLERAQGWPKGLRALKVTLTHGYTAVPPVVLGVAVDMLRDHKSAGEMAEGNVATSIRLDDADIAFANPYAPRGGSTNVAIRRDISLAYGHLLGRYRL